MKKEEFLIELRKRLTNDDCQDVDDIISYYDELIEDRKENEIEEDIIKSLGTIDDIAVRVNIKSSCNTSMDKIHYDEYEETKEDNKPISKKQFIWGIVILAVSSPIWIALIALGVVSLVAVAMSIVSIGISGFAYIADGGFIIIDNLANGIFEIGIGFAAIGLSFTLAPFIIKLYTFIIKKSITLVKWIIAKFKEWRN